MTTRSKQTGEVFTPLPLVAEMLRRLPRDIWSSRTKTFLDNSAGEGAFLYAAKKLLMAGHGDERAILEDQLFAVEIMPDNVMKLQERLGWLVRESGTDRLVPNPILDPKHFSIDPILHTLPDGSEPPDTYVLDGKGAVLHHRNVVCADALKYDYSFGR